MSQPLADLNAARDVQAALQQIIVGKNQQLMLAVTCLVAGGHLLLEDVPGVGKTTAAKALAAVFGLEFNRVQFTADLLPADILGASVYHADSGEFRFHAGPVFCQLLLADEINRASPRTQSALLEAMAEGRVTQDGISHALPAPFFVVATQNPLEQVGTWPLPESQLDRFMMRLSFGYPAREDERMLLKGDDREAMLAAQSAVSNPAALVAMQQAIRTIHISDDWLDYLQALLAASREPGDSVGLSPRAGLALKKAGQAAAWLAGRDYATPDDLQAVFVAVAGHRLTTAAGSRRGSQLAAELLKRVAIP